MAQTSSILLLISLLVVAIDGFAAKLRSGPAETRIISRVGRPRACAPDDNEAQGVDDDSLKRGQEYYSGMLQSPLDFRADEDLDNVTPNIKLVLGVSAFLIGLTALFLLGNAPPPASYS